MLDPLGNEKNFGFLKTAMDAASMRHQLLSANLANIDTPGYKAKDIDFEAVLRDFSDAEAMQPTRDANTGMPPAQPLNIKNYLIEDSPSLTDRYDGNNVDLDQTMADLGVARSRYQLATQFMNRKARILNEVINSR